MSTFAPRSPAGRVARARVGEFIKGGHTPGRDFRPRFLSTPLGNINGTATVAITPVPTRALFWGVGTFSLVGAWPVGLVIDAATGIITGTVAAPITTPGLTVRLTNAAGAVANSNAITVTIV